MEVNQRALIDKVSLDDWNVAGGLCQVFGFLQMKLVCNGSYVSWFSPFIAMFRHKGPFLRRFNAVPFISSAVIPLLSLSIASEFPLFYQLFITHPSANRLRFWQDMLPQEPSIENFSKIPMTPKPPRLKLSYPPPEKVIPPTILQPHHLLTISIPPKKLSPK